jgi:N-acetylmuramoyl-L-alanine amidase
MGKLKYLVVHCTDTPPSMEVTREMIEQWHKGPRDLDGGGVRYLGKTYRSRKDLPKDTIGGVPITHMHGRGWDRLGYSVMIQRDGKRVELTPYNNDDKITSDEMTWGVAGINSIARHVVLVGGKGPLYDFKYHFTEEQDIELFAYCKLTILHHPEIVIIGHNQAAEKSCPGFFVYDWLMDKGIESFGLRKRRI